MVHAWLRHAGVRLEEKCHLHFTMCRSEVNFFSHLLPAWFVLQLHHIISMNYNKMFDFIYSCLSGDKISFPVSFVYRLSLVQIHSPYLGQ